MHMQQVPGGALSGEQAPARYEGTVRQHGGQLSIYGSNIWQRCQVTTHGLNGTSADLTLLPSLLTNHSFVSTWHTLSRLQ